ncbi:MAG: hypothetical protein ACI9SP_000036 [Arenicella sp.]|jgi:uncharacterized protein YjbI with pentapeptide repeats
MAAPKVFISYKNGHQASEDFIANVEAELAADFELLRDKNISVGKPWTRELYDWLLGCDAAIIVLSKEANQSDWCRREWAVLVARWVIKGIPVIPVCMEDSFFETGILDDIQGTKGFLLRHNAINKIKDSLKEITSSSMTADDFLAAHQGWLSWQYNDAPVFQREPYALADVYIESDCGELSWQQIKDDKLDPFTEQTDRAELKKTQQGGDREPLLDTVMAKLADPDFNELITVQAGPGAGKSAFTLRLAHELMQEGLQPILVRFRDLRLNNFSNVAELLDDAIRIGFTDDDSPHPETEIISQKLHQTKLLGKANISRIVIILDGWDEVSLSGNESYSAQLSTALPKIREYFTGNRTTKIRLILTGRPSTEASDSGLLKKATPVLTIRPVRPEQLREFANRTAERLKIASISQQGKVTDKQEPSEHPNSELWQLDQNKLEPVFKHYEDWFSGSREASGNSTGDFLGNPLLAYLSFRVLAETDQSPETLISNPTALYQELLNITIKNAGKGQNENLEDTVQRGGKSLRTVLQEVAVTISILRSESASFEELKARFGDSDLPIRRELLKDWHEQADASTALQELVVNFYFKGGNTHLGCEFLHKSFREYLFAEAIYSALLDAAEGHEGIFKPQKSYHYWEDFPLRSSENKLSRRLGYLLAPQNLSNEVRTHLFWLIDAAIAEDPQKWLWLRGIMLTIYAWWAEGVLLRHQPTGSRAGSAWQAPYVNKLFLQVIPFANQEPPAPVRTCVYDAHLGIALLQMTARIFSGLHESGAGESRPEGRDSAYIENSEKDSRLRPFGASFAGSIVARFNSAGWWVPSGLEGMYLGFVSLKESDLRQTYMIGTDLTGADLTRADLRRADLRRADLRRADLRRADLTRADLRRADLTRADLRRADLRGADLRRADLRWADLREGDLREGDLREAGLEGADLGGAGLRGADLRAVYLTGADLTGADLTGVDLTLAYLTEDKSLSLEFKKRYE